MCLSVPQMAAAPTRITTSPDAGLGTGQSRISVPETPSSGCALTTACMFMRNVGRAFARRAGGRAEARPTFAWKVSQRLMRRMPPKQPSETAERRVDGVVERAHRRFDLVRVDGEIAREAADLAHQRIGVAYPKIFVQTAVDDEELLARRGTLVVELVRHPAGADLVRTAVDDHH